MIGRLEGLSDLGIRRGLERAGPGVVLARADRRQDILERHPFSVDALHVEGPLAVMRVETNSQSSVMFHGKAPGNDGQRPHFTA
jgi:hypothetical protein